MHYVNSLIYNIFTSHYSFLLPLKLCFFVTFTYQILEILAIRNQIVAFTNLILEFKFKFILILSL